MIFFWLYILVIISGIVLSLTVFKRKHLIYKFSLLGNMAGMNYMQIKNVVGKEHYIIHTFLDGNAVTVRVWSAVNYHKMLIFDGADNFIGICNAVAM